MRKLSLLFVILAVLLTACGESKIVQSYPESAEEGIVYTYHQLSDDSWQCEDVCYLYRLELSGTLPNAAGPSCYVLLSDRNDWTFEEVARCMYSSNYEEVKQLNGSKIVEIR